MPAVIDVLIPAYNEVETIARVIEAIPKQHVRHVIVADNNSRDGTADAARAAGAIVVPATTQGYGSACLAAMAHVKSLDVPPDVVVFVDADLSDFPEQLPLLTSPIVEGRADFVLGSRTMKPDARRSLTPQQRFGNAFACLLMRFTVGHRYTDLGPFRAIRWQSLLELGMTDPNYGWTVEMQIKAARAKLRILEIPVDYRDRAGGRSKVSGTINGVIRAGYKIIFTIFRYAVR